MKISPNNPCPCCSGKKYKKCCKIFHDGQNPRTAQELMRSRYCAFSIKKAQYIIDTTHQENSDFTHDLEQWRDSILDFCSNTKFEAMEIIDFIDGQTQSFVTFKAALIQKNTDASFCEKSRFLKTNNKWLYIDGEFL